MISEKNTRFILSLPEHQLKLLKRISYIDDISIAEVVRTAVSEYLYDRLKNISEEEKLKEFWMNAIRTENKCLEWQGPFNGGGYGTTREILGETAAHRIAYKASRGSITDGLYVCHKCDNPKCIDPDHLFLGTANDNFIDMVNKGRQKHVGRQLTGEQAAHIIRLYYGRKGLRMRHLAEKFGVGIQTISRVLNRKTFIEDPLVIKEWEVVDKRYD